MSILANLKMPVLVLITLLTIPLSIIESYFSSRYALGFGATGVLGLWLIFQIGLIITLFLLAVSKRKKVYIILASVSILAFFLTHYISGKHQTELSKQSQEQGDQLVLAVSRFQKDKGQLPASLDELVPAYLANIPQPKFINSRYSYGINKEKDDFWIRYSAPAWMLCERSSKSSWVCDD